MDFKELKRLIELFNNGGDLSDYAKDKLLNFINEQQNFQLKETGVLGSSCEHDEENDTKAYAKNGNEFIGYYCDKCDTVYCGSI